MGSLYLRLSRHNRPVFLCRVSASPRTAGQSAAPSPNRRPHHRSARGGRYEPFCLIVAFSGRGLVVGLAALLLGLCCVAFGISASLGFLATNKDAAFSERAQALDALQQA